MSQRRDYSAISARMRRVVTKARGLARGKKRFQHELELVGRSPLFDGAWYIEAYPDVAKSGSDPLRHYLKTGWLQGRNPGPEFDTLAYLAENADVAGSGFNPLAHYIEFGRAEGRGTADHRPGLREFEPQSFGFAEPAPVASFPTEEAVPVRWPRLSDLDRTAANLLVLDAIPVGYAAGSVEADFRAVAQAFSLLSGYGEPSVNAGVLLKAWVERLVDAWHVNSARLRMRWSAGAAPFVVRAFQHDPGSDGRIAKIGEALVSTELTVVDFCPRNPLCPILFVFVELDGQVRGAGILAFPSLCRGGLHYGELVSLSATCNPVDEGNRRACDLLHRLQGETEPLVGRVEVGLTGGDGRAPLFQADFRHWLNHVVRVGLRPIAAGSEDASEQYLEASFVDTLGPLEAVTGATLKLSHDMVPTIAILTASLEGGDAGTIPSGLPMLIAGAAADQTLIKVEISRLGEDSAAHPSEAAAAVVRTRYRALSDAELFTPLAGEALGTELQRRQAITWVLDTEGADAEMSVQCLIALAKQDGAAEDRVAIIGPISGEIECAAQTLFAERAEALRDAGLNFDKVETPLASHLSAAVLLHDRRTASCLSSLLQDARIATAGCVLIRTKGQAPSSRTVIADPGALLSFKGSALEPAAAVEIAQQLWRSVYRVACPSRDLWVGRVDRLRDGAREDGGAHLCTSFVTASVRGNREAGDVGKSFSSATDLGCTRGEVLLG